MDLNQSLAKANKSLCNKQPFYGLFLMMLNKSWSKSLETAGVRKQTINYYLMINPDFWESLKESWRVGILQHEALHIAFFHLERHEEYENQKIANVAMDMEINQFIDEDCLPAFDIPKKKYEYPLTIDNDAIRQECLKELYKVPPRGVYLKDFPELNLEPKMGTRYYYDRLMDGKDKKPGDPGYSPLLDQMNQAFEAEDIVLIEHDWEDFEGMTESESKLMHKQIDTLLKETANQIKKSRGLIPDHLAGYIDSLDKTEPPKFNWKSYLRRFAGGSRKVYTKKLHRKFNKRYEDLPGLKLKPLRRILVAVDTSGSVQNEELKEFFHEIYHITKMGTEVVVVQCDAAISNIAEYKKGFEDKIKVHGRGGTSFDPPVDYFNEHKRDFSCMVYLTDGEAPPPVNKVQGHILWVLSTQSTDNEQLFPRIKLN